MNVSAKQYKETPTITPATAVASSRKRCDEAYVVSLCDSILGVAGIRQHRFDFLRGDSRTERPGKPLPVDVYYPSLHLVIEYRERQHTEAVPFFDKPHRLTVSGVPRREQRAIYDKRRREIVPKHGIELVEVAFFMLAHDARRRLLREQAEDRVVVTWLLAKWVGASVSCQAQRVDDDER